MVVGETWAPTEHEQFVNALEKYGGGTMGNEWELIARACGRTVTEVKEHAQQYFQKLESDGGSSDMLSIKHDIGFSSPLSRIKNEPLSPSLKSPFGSSLLSHTSAPFDAHDLGQGLAAPLFPPASHATFLSDSSESYITSAQFVQQPVSAGCSGSVADAFAAGQAGGADSKEGVTWTLEENVVFENALSTYDERVATPERWYKIASLLGSKSVHDVMKHYERLAADIRKIDEWHVSLPPYANSWFTSNWPDSKRNQLRKSPTKGNEERRKGVPWTEDEHRLFLLGLQKHGKGDWRNISRNFVVSRTPTQVASHAQKFFIRLNSVQKDKRQRSSMSITAH